MQGGFPQFRYEKKGHPGYALSYGLSPPISSGFDNAVSHVDAVGFGDHHPPMHNFSVGESFEHPSPEDRRSGPPGSSPIAEAYEPGKTRKSQEREPKVDNERTGTKRRESKGKEPSSTLLISESDPNMACGLSFAHQ
jgi:hypothetical protein